MHQENYSMRWHTYSDHLRDMMKELMMNDDFADVTLVTEDKKHMKAHKNILSTCSFVFKVIFQQLLTFAQHFKGYMQLARYPTNVSADRNILVTCCNFLYLFVSNFLTFCNFLATF